MWFFYALLSGILYTIQGLVTRYILKGKKDSWAFSFYFSAIGAMISLPLMLMNLKFDINAYSWLLMVVAGILIVIQNLLQFKSSNYIGASIQGIIQKFRLVWVFIFGVLVLKEAFTWQKIIGTVLTIIAGLIVLNKAKEKQSMKGIILTFIATFFYGVVIMLYKFLFKSFNTQSLTFFIFFVPALINVISMPDAFRRIVRYFKENTLFVLIAGSTGAFANLTMNLALSTGEISKVIVIIEAFLVVTLIGEHLVLKERDHLKVKIVTILLVIIGALLIRLSR